MQKKRALAASRNPTTEDVYTIRGEQNTNNSIVFYAGADQEGEILKITKDGFWVRGVKVDQDSREAKLVYDAFHEWMVWSAITRRY